MLDLTKVTGFEWDKGNINKSYRKHGVTPREAEEIFLDENLQVETAIKHQEIEKRYIAIGQTAKEQTLFVVFTLRNNKVRILSARSANKKERRKYEEAIKAHS